LAGAGCFSTGGAVTGALFCGAAGAAGRDFVAGAFIFSNTLPEVAAPRLARIDNESDVTMNSAAASVVALESKVADPRGPKAVCDPMPPNAPARSAAFPLCSNTTIIMKKQTMTWIMVKRIVIRNLESGSIIQRL